MTGRTEEQLIYLGAKREVVAIDPRDGRTVWRQRLDEWFGSYQTLIVDGDRLLVARHGVLYAFDRRSGDRLWKVGMPRLKHVPIMMASSGGSTMSAAQTASAMAQQQAAMAAATVAATTAASAG